MLELPWVRSIKVTETNPGDVQLDSLQRILPSINLYRIAIYMCALLVVSGFSAAHVQAAQIRTEQELAELKDSIRELRNKLQADRGRQQSITDQLESIERDRSKLDDEFATRTLELEDLQVEKMEVSISLHNLGLERDRTQKKLRRLLVASYMLSQQDGLQLALRQANPEKIATTMEMYRYLVEAHQRLVDYTREVHHNYRQTASRVEKQQNTIDDLLQELELNRQSLGELEQERGEQLALVNVELSKGENKVRQYEVREAELQQLLHSLARRREAEKVSTATPSSNESGLAASGTAAIYAGVSGAGSRDFGGSRGSMQMPAYGKILKRFGQKRPESGLAWDGILLGVQEGEPVSAVFRGQVVFSDWFGSFGQLLVLDHGDGYMSLYGHNQLLHVSIGSMVDSGQKIASAGSTGGLLRPALYFEIRHNGNPDDPLKWCKL
jgi:septal ring factor EnvC (AmiA/AmiB activator)